MYKRQPFYDASGQLIGHIQVARLLDNFGIFSRVLSRALLINLGAALASLGVLYVLTSTLFRPLEDITTVARQITRADDLSRLVPHSNRTDEIGDLARAFNQTLERLERLFRSQQRFLADVSHELRTPLTSVRGNLDLMRRFGEYDEESMFVIQDEMERMGRLRGALLLLALPWDIRNAEVLPLFRDPFRLACRAGSPLLEKGRPRADPHAPQSALRAGDGALLRGSAPAALPAAPPATARPGPYTANEVTPAPAVPTEPIHASPPVDPRDFESEVLLYQAVAQGWIELRYDVVVDASTNRPMGVHGRVWIRDPRGSDVPLRVATSDAARLGFSRDVGRAAGGSPTFSATATLWPKNSLASASMRERKRSRFQFWTKRFGASSVSEDASARTWSGRIQVLNC